MSWKKSIWVFEPPYKTLVLRKYGVNGKGRNDIQSHIDWLCVQKKIQCLEIANLGRRSFKKYTINPVDTSRDNKESQSSRKISTASRKDSSAADNTLQPLDEICKKKVGYLVKSPSRMCLRNKIARWHLRWFVLYDTQPRCDVDETIEREIELLYYKNHQEEQRNCQPLGERLLFFCFVYFSFLFLLRKTCVYTN